MPGSVFQRYYYDALGRRIRTDADIDEGQWNQYVYYDYDEEVAWDGSQILFERRNSNKVYYTHALAIDQPISFVYGTSATVMPLRSFRGAFDQGNVLRPIWTLPPS